MNAVGIDVSKGKSMVTILRPFGEVVVKPFNVNHTRDDVDNLISIIKSCDGESRVVMEATGKYHKILAIQLSLAGIFVCRVNPILVRNFDKANSLRKTKTDKADSLKIARYAIDKWNDLSQYDVMEDLRSQLKLLNRQHAFYVSQKTAMKNNFISLLDDTFPGINTMFDSPVREDGSQKWVDFAAYYWHVDCVRTLSLQKFSDSYRKWCSKHKYNFSQDKVQEIYDFACQVLPTLPKDESTKRVIKNASDQIMATSKTLADISNQMQEVASQLPEYEMVMSMYGTGPKLGPQLMAEIGDVRRFKSKGALCAFAGVDPERADSGSIVDYSKPITKRGSPHLRKTLFLIVSAILQKMPPDDPVYQFMDKKRSEGKPYYVYMTAGANKFLRIYYGIVKGYLDSIQETETE